VVALGPAFAETDADGPAKVKQRRMLRAFPVPGRVEDWAAIGGQVSECRWGGYHAHMRVARDEPRRFSAVVGPFFLLPAAAVWPLPPCLVAEGTAPVG
jgi:hypothetical protein